MSESTSSAVECPVCGESFDPTEAGGWCTNAECGEWQYIGDEVPEPAAPEGNEGVTAPDLKRSANESGDGEADEAAAAEGEAADAPPEDADEPAAEAAASDPGPDEDETEAGPTPAIRRIGDEDDEEAADGTDTATDGTDTAADQRDTASGVAEASDERPCPDCGDPVDPADNFCASCGADLDTDPEPTLAACPACEAAVEPDDSFCPSCGEDLAAARAALEAAAGDTNPAADDAAESSGTTSEAETDADEPTPESLVLRVRGEEIAVADGETVGREVRSVITQTGGEEDQAVRVHREHLRFVRESGRFYIVDLGDNPTRLNGTRLSKGDREPVTPGDEIELSGVATLAVDSP